MAHVIQGTHNDSVGMLIAGYFHRATGYPVVGPFSAMGWVENGNLVGQALFFDYTGANIEIHLNYPNGLKRRNIQQVYDFVFNQSKCERLTAKPYCTNEKLLQLLERLGFVYEFTQKDYYREGDKLIDAVVYKLTKSTLPKWVKLNAQA